MMNELYDFTDVFNAEIAPLMRQVFDKCREHDLPMVIGITYANRAKADGKGGDFKMLKACHLPGAERTPITYRVADEAIGGDPNQAAFLAMMIASEYRNNVEVQSDEAGQVEA